MWDASKNTTNGPKTPKMKIVENRRYDHDTYGPVKVLEESSEGVVFETENRTHLNTDIPLTKSVSRAEFEAACTPLAVTLDVPASKTGVEIPDIGDTDNEITET